MAYMSQEKKAKIAPAVKTILKKYGIKGTLSVDNHSTLVLKIKSGKIDFIKNHNETTVGNPMFPDYLSQPAKDYIDINPYYYEKHFSGDALAFLTEILTAMNAGNHDRSDSMTDYFDVGWYVNVKIGHWSNPYILEA